MENEPQKDTPTGSVGVSYPADVLKCHFNHKGLEKCADKPYYQIAVVGQPHPLSAVCMKGLHHQVSELCAMNVSFSVERVWPVR